MNKAEQAGLELREIDELAAQDSILHRLSPLSKLFVTVFYIAVTVSFPKYALTRLVWMALFPVAGYQLAGLPMRLCFQKLRMVLPLVCAVGLLNPLFDRQIVVQVGTLAVSGGVLSMLTLILKGVFRLLASFLLMATTTIEAICRALRQLHVPKLLTNLLLLTFRYVGLLLSEVAVMQQAYSLRAPGQKGIHISAWGSFLGQLLLRSMDRAQALYESMELRGFSSEFSGAVRGRGSAASWPYALVCPALMLLARYFDLSALMKAALGLVPYTGSITVDGLPVTRENLPAVRRKLGYVLQDADNQMFMPTVLDDMLFGPMNYGLSRAEAERQADETLASLHMEHLKLRHNHKMSGGEKRMAAIAVILAMKPDMLFMDEPSTALDPRNRRTLINVLRARPETKLIASHDLDLVLETCRRVLLIADGALAADGPAQELLRDKALLEANGLELPLCLAGVPEF